MNSYPEFGSSDEQQDQLDQFMLQEFYSDSVLDIPSSIYEEVDGLPSPPVAYDDPYYPGSVDAQLSGETLLMEYQTANGIGVFGQEAIPPAYNSGIMIQADDSSSRVGQLSPEERKEKIQRYMKKKNERNFTKRIKYACRKILADSRPRVRGRFVKHDDFGETTKSDSICRGQEEEDEEVMMRQTEEMIESPDIFAHVSGMNSFDNNYAK